ncbi:unnamed protein product, partial [Brassica oleracea]
FCGAPILPNYNKNYRIKDESVEYGFPIPKPSGNESDNLELSSSVKIIVWETEFEEETSSASVEKMKELSPLHQRFRKDCLQVTATQPVLAWTYI